MHRREAVAEKKWSGSASRLIADIPPPTVLDISLAEPTMTVEDIPHLAERQLSKIAGVARMAAKVRYQAGVSAPPPWAAMKVKAAGAKPLKTVTARL